MDFARTYDEAFIHKCLTHPSVWRMSIDDTMSDVDPDLFFPPINDNIYWLKAGDYGVFMGIKGDDSYDVHVVLLPEARGKSVEISVGAMKWFFDNTDVDKLTASIPVFNSLAARLAKKSGMKEVGVREKAYIKDNILHDLILFQIERGDLCHH